MVNTNSIEWQKFRENASMSQQEASSKQRDSKQNSKQQDLAKKVAERVWQLWQQDMRRNRERIGKQHGSK